MSGKRNRRTMTHEEGKTLTERAESAEEHQLVRILRRQSVSYRGPRTSPSEMPSTFVYRPFVTLGRGQLRYAVELPVLAFPYGRPHPHS